MRIRISKTLISFFVTCFILLSYTSSTGGNDKTDRTWIEVNGEIYGAKPDDNGPIGGGSGYRKSIITGQYNVKDLDGLLAALKSVKEGEIIFIDGHAEIDCTDLVFTEKFRIKLPAGVILASDRGYKNSEGAIIKSDNFATKPLISVLGPKVRITGLRIIGPDPKSHLEHHKRSFNPERGDSKAQSAYYYLLPNSEGISTEHGFLEVDNCELSGWSHAAIYLRNGDEQHIHHNYIHHNQRNGLGYGVCLGYGKNISALIEFNLFDYNRHSIAGTGVPGNSYEASNNIELGHSLSHNFDMHGGKDRRDGTNIGGERVLIHHNIFTNPKVRAVAIRGIPGNKADIYNNWFAQDKPGTEVINPWPATQDSNVFFRNNAFGKTNPIVFK
jgi:pectate lyase